MFGVTYRVVPVDGEAWEFTSTLADETAWEAYAVKHKLPIMPTSVRDMATFPMATNAGVLAWSHAGRPGPLEEFMAGLRIAMPTGDEDEVAPPPDPTRPGPGPD